MNFIIIYIITKEYQKKQIENSKKFIDSFDKNYSKNDEELVNKTIIDLILNDTKNRYSQEYHSFLKKELLKYNYEESKKNIFNYNFTEYIIDIQSSLLEKELSEKTSLTDIDKQLSDLLSLNGKEFDINNNIIITIEKNKLDMLISLFIKDKIKSKILFNHNYNKPISVLMSKYNLLFK